LARKAIESALRVEKEEKREEYIIDNDIQSLKDILREILKNRDRNIVK
jgi:hypothetical protein